MDLAIDINYKMKNTNRFFLCSLYVLKLEGIEKLFLFEPMHILNYSIYIKEVVLRCFTLGFPSFFFFFFFKKKVHLDVTINKIEKSIHFIYVKKNFVACI
jgi:hypothetical protein